MRLGALADGAPHAFLFGVELVRRSGVVGAGAAHDLALDSRRGPLRERVTLQAESGDARVVALERLASELEAVAAGGPPGA